MPSGESRICAATSDSMRIRWPPVCPLTLLAITFAFVCSAQIAPAPDVQALKERLAILSHRYDDTAPNKLGSPDEEVFLKGATWALKYEPDMSPADRALVAHTLDRAEQRIRFRPEDTTTPSWRNKKGRVVRGYRSAVDGSVQPYGLVIPQSYDPKTPGRLDVVLHGSSRPTGMSELRFMSQFGEGDEGGKPITDRDYVELHPLGRVENCYRWAGETDVFEAIKDVCEKYNIDRRRIVLRGMSMGASGTWHLGLKHPDFFVALGPYCGYVDTHRFSETQGMNFVKVGPLPPHQEAGLHMLDSVDYAANAGMVPTIAAMGEKDPFFQAHVIMGEAMKREGLEMVNLISPGTGHVQEPKTFGEQMRRIAEYAGRGLEYAPKHIRFVTWTLKYNRCFWIDVKALDRHYERAEIDVTAQDDGLISVKEPHNIREFVIHQNRRLDRLPKLIVGEQVVQIPTRYLQDDGILPRVLWIVKQEGRWTCAGTTAKKHMNAKRNGVQGPIDDAFTRDFLCIRGTGKPWNPGVQEWADANLKRFAYEWHRYFRGELPIKNDADVTKDDRNLRNLILFGDPGSNRLIREALPKLPIKWDAHQLQIAGASYSSVDHSPALINPSPLCERGWSRYVVINSGHTFHEAELNRLNYLLFPRLGDWAVIKVGPKTPATPSDPLDEEVIKAGYFDETWRFPKPDRK